SRPPARLRPPRRETTSGSWRESRRQYSCAAPFAVGITTGAQQRPTRIHVTCAIGGGAAWPHDPALPPPDARPRVFLPHPPKNSLTVLHSLKARGEALCRAACGRSTIPGHNARTATA